MTQLQVHAEPTARVTPEAVWALVSNAIRYLQWGPPSAAGCQRRGDRSARGPGAVHWLKSSRRYWLPRVTPTDRILDAEEGHRLVYTVIGDIPVPSYWAGVTLTPSPSGIRVRSTAYWDGDDTLSGRIVNRGLRRLYPQTVADLVIAAEQQAANRAGQPDAR